MTTILDMIECVPNGWKITIEPYAASGHRCYIVSFFDSDGVRLNYFKCYTMPFIEGEMDKHWIKLAASNIIDPKPKVQDFGMFSPEGNAAVQHALDQIKLAVSGTKVMFADEVEHAIYQAAERLSFKYPEVTDTVVRENMFAYIEGGN
jgi:hypothetical protein